MYTETRLKIMHIQGIQKLPWDSENLIKFIVMYMMQMIGFSNPDLQLTIYNIHLSSITKILFQHMFYNTFERMTYPTESWGVEW